MVEEFSTRTIENPAPGLWIVSGKNDNAACELWELALLHNESFLIDCIVELLLTIGYFCLAASNLVVEPMRLPPMFKCFISYCS